MLDLLNKKSISAICLGVGLTFSTLGFALPVSAEIVNSELSQNNKASVEWNQGEKNTIQAIGIGLAPVDSYGVKGRILARRAAVVDAQRNLLEYINGVSLDADTNVSNLSVGSDVVRTQVSGIIRAAKVVSEKFNNDGSYEVILSVPMYGQDHSLASVVIPKLAQNLSEVKEPSMETNINYSVEFPENVTGVVVDAKGLGMEATFAPAIYDVDGRIVYGLQKVDHYYAINHGLVQYATNFTEINRAGANPLILKALSVRGGKNSTNPVNPVVSKEDGDKIILANKKSNFVKNCAVVFVR